MTEESQTIFSKLLNKDKEIEDFRVQIKTLQEEKYSLEYMLIKSSEQIRKMQEDSETQCSNRSQSDREQEKLLAEIEFLKKDIQITRMNCQSYEKTNNLLGIEIQNLQSYINKLSGTVNNAYNVISHYQTVEKEKLNLEEKFKRQKKKYKTLQNDQQSLKSKLTELDSVNKIKDQSQDLSKKLEELAQRMETQKKDNSDLQTQVAEKERENLKLKQQLEEQQKNINALNKQMSFLKIEKLSFQNKFEHAKNELLHVNSFSDQQSTLKRNDIFINSKQRTKSLDNSYNNYNQHYKLKTEGGQYEEEILNKTSCSFSNKPYNSLQNNVTTKTRTNSCSPSSGDMKKQTHYLTIKNIRDMYHLKEHQNSTSHCVQDQMRYNSLKEANYTNFKPSNQITINQSLKELNNCNCCQRKLNSSYSSNSILTGNDLSGCNIQVHKHSQNLNNSFNDCSGTLSDCQHKKFDQKLLQYASVNQDSATFRYHSPLPYNLKINNSQNIVKQVLLMIEELIIKEKVDKNQQTNLVENILEISISKDDKLILDSIDIIVQHISQLQSWECFNVVLLAQKFKNLIKIILNNSQKLQKQNNTLYEIGFSTNQAQSLQVPLKNDCNVSEKDILQGVCQIIEQIGGDEQDDLTEEQRTRKLKLSLNTNHISIIKDMEEAHITKATDETILIEKLGKVATEQTEQPEEQLNKIVEQDDIKHLLTELQELNQSTDYNQYTQFFLNRKRTGSISAKLPKQNAKQQVLQSIQPDQPQQTIIQLQKQVSDQIIQTDQINECSCQEKDKKTQMTNNNNTVETQQYVEKLKKQMQQQFSKKVKDLEQVLLVIKSLLNDEKENQSQNVLNQSCPPAHLSEKLQKLYSTNPNLKPFLQNFIEKIDELKSSNQQLQFEVKKYQLSNKHIKQIR